MFSPLKAMWNKRVAEWGLQFPGIEITQKNFPEVIRPIWEKLVSDPRRVRKAFQVCGMFPWDKNAVKYDRLIKKAGSKDDDPLSHIPESQSTVTLTHLGGGRQMLSIPIEDQEHSDVMLQALRAGGFNVITKKVSALKSPDFQFEMQLALTCILESH